MSKDPSGQAENHKHSLPYKGIPCARSPSWPCLLAPRDPGSVPESCENGRGPHDFCTSTTGWSIRPKEEVRERSGGPQYAFSGSHVAILSKEPTKCKDSARPCQQKV